MVKLTGRTLILLSLLVGMLLVFGYFALVGGGPVVPGRNDTEIPSDVIVLGEDPYLITGESSLPELPEDLGDI